MPKVALITGAAARVGQCLTQTLHRQGFNIALHYRSSKQAALELADRLNEQRANSVRCFQADLNKVDEVQQLATEAQSAWQGIDVLINNASSFYPTDILTTTEAQWHDLIGSNLKGAFFLSQALVRTLGDRQGCIINIIDIHAERPLEKYSLYCIAKAGLAMMTKALAKELGPNIRVNGISPGAILWPDQDKESLGPYT